MARNFMCEIHVDIILDITMVFMKNHFEISSM